MAVNPVDFALSGGKGGIRNRQRTTAVADGAEEIATLLGGGPFVVGERVGAVEGSGGASMAPGSGSAVTTGLIIGGVVLAAWAITRIA